jgi:GNAT superfamily N-acetyltransferase
MTIEVRPLSSEDVGEVVEFSLRAWQPVFESFAKVLGAEIYERVYPDWAAGQALAVETVCRDDGAQVWVAEFDGRPVGFVATVVHEDPVRAEIDMVAVDPDYQGRGIGSLLVAGAVERATEAGVPVMEIATGGDPGHAPARRVYEKAGFTALPLVRYYKALPGETRSG